MANNKANVSTVRGVEGGYLFSAPAGTAAPTDYETKLPDAFECHGYVSEDGLAEAVDKSTGEIKDMNGDVCDTYQESAKETVKFSLMEVGEESLSAQYGHANVTSDEKMITVDHNWGRSEEERVWVAELVMKNGRRWRKVIPAGKVTDVAEVKLNSKEAAMREITVTYNTDSNGSGAKDYIQKAEATPASEAALVSETVSPKSTKTEAK